MFVKFVTLLEYDFLFIKRCVHISRYIPVILKSKMVWRLYPLENLTLLFQNVQNVLNTLCSGNVLAKMGTNSLFTQKTIFLAKIRKRTPNLKSASLTCAMCKISRKTDHFQKMAKFGLKSPFLPKFWKMIPGFEISTP